MKILIYMTIITFMAFGISEGTEMTADPVVNYVQEEPAAAAEEPVYTPTPAEEYGIEKDVVAPSIAGDIITDTEEITNIISNTPYWAEKDSDTNILWLKDGGRYVDCVNAFMESYNVYSTGKWYFREDMLALESMEEYVQDNLEELLAGEVTPDKSLEYLENATTLYVPIATVIDDEIHLYLCTELSYTEYVPATENEKLLVSTDPQYIANIRYFICSATWLLVGHYDEDKNYSHRSNTRAYTFLMDGQLVVRENGVNTAGYYTLNYRDDGFVDLTYLLEDGRGMYTPLWADNSSSYASSIFLYPDYLSYESDVYMAKYKYNVTSYVDEGDPILAYPGS